MNKCSLFTVLEHSLPSSSNTWSMIELFPAWSNSFVVTSTWWHFNKQEVVFPQQPWSPFTVKCHLGFLVSGKKTYTTEALAFGFHGKLICMEFDQVFTDPCAWTREIRRVKDAIKYKKYSLYMCETNKLFLNSTNSNLATSHNLIIQPKCGLLKKILLHLTAYGRILHPFNSTDFKQLYSKLAVLWFSSPYTAFKLQQIAALIYRTQEELNPEVMK